MKGVEGSRLNVKGKTQINFKLGNQTFTHSFVICDINTPILLGRDFLQLHSVIIRYDNPSLEIGGETIPLENHNYLTSMVKVTHNVKLKPRTTTICYAKVRQQNSKIGDKVFQVSRIDSGILSDHPGIYPMDGLIHISSPCKFPIILVNSTSQHFSIKKGSMIGKIEDIDSICSVKASLLKDIDESINDPLPNPPKHNIPHEYSDKINALLRDYKCIFSQKDTDIGNTDLLKMKIDLTSDKPVNIPPYRIPLHKRDAVDKTIENLLESGIVRPSISPYNAPVVLVKKKGPDKYRMVVDYRALNSITKPVVQPLENIDGILASLGKAKFLSKLDLKSAYHHMSIVENDKEKTAFSVGYKHLEFNRAPFGLMNSGSYFSQLMSIVLKGIKGIYVINYLDDILVYSEDFESHIRHLTEVFKRLKQANFKLNLAKCEFVKSSVEYLGHVIDATGLRPNPEKVSAIQSAPAPKTVRGVRGFIGIMSYYRRYIPRFSELAEPLINLTRKNSKFIWDDHCQKSFESLKKSLQSPPILAYPDTSKQFILYCDASDKAVGSVLMQKQDGIEKPIYFLSHSLSQTQRRWPIIEKEAFSIIYSLQKLDFFLSDTHIPFIIKTDHKPLKYLFTAKQSNRKLQMWSVALSAYNCSIEYVEGKKNILADFFSRYTQPQNAISQTINVINSNRINIRANVKVQDTSDVNEQHDNKDVETPVFDIPGNFDISHAQCNDPTVEKIRKQISNNTASEHVKQHHTIVNKILYYISTNDLKISLRIVIPDSLKTTILQHFHDNNSHLGIDKTFDLISQRYYWKSMFTDVANYVSLCITCNARDINRNKVPLQPTDIPQFPFEKIAIDTSGPFIESSSGNKYIISVMDMFSSWVEAFPVPDKSAQTAAKIILNEIIPRYSCPLYILSDNGTEYRNEIISTINKHLKIHHILTSPYRPQSNSKIERFHRVMHDLISKHLFSTQDERNWDLYLPHVLSALRVSTNTSTKFSPHFLLFNRDPIMPLDTLLKPRVKYLGDEEHQINLQRLHIAYTVARDNIKKSQEKRLTRENQNTKNITFSVGDAVYLYNANKSTKHSVRWFPYHRIVKQTGPVSYMVRDQVSGRLRRAHAQHLKLAKLDKWDIPKRDANLRRSKLACRRDDSTDASGPESDDDNCQGVIPPLPENISSDTETTVSGEPPLAFLPQSQPPPQPSRLHNTNQNNQSRPTKRKQSASPEFSTEDNIPLARLQKRLRNENISGNTNNSPHTTPQKPTENKPPIVNPKHDGSITSSDNESSYDDALETLPDQSYRAIPIQTLRNSNNEDSSARESDNISIRKLQLIKEILNTLK